MLNEVPFAAIIFHDHKTILLVTKNMKNVIESFWTDVLLKDVKINIDSAALTISGSRFSTHRNTENCRIKDLEVLKTLDIGEEGLYEKKSFFQKKSLFFLKKGIYIKKTVTCYELTTTVPWQIVKEEESNAS